MTGYDKQQTAVGGMIGGKCLRGLRFSLIQELESVLYWPPLSTPREVTGKTNTVINLPYQGLLIIVVVSTPEVGARGSWWCRHYACLDIIEETVKEVSRWSKG